MIDRTLVIRKISLISKDLNALEPYAALSLNDYLKDSINEVLVERYLERMIGRMIDINYHLITELDHPPPKDYFESFVELGRLGVLEPEFARSAAQAAGLRNRIVHEYDEIDEQKVYESLLTAAKDIPTYLQAVHVFVERASKE
ncbi:MAG: DUF86 domain-containing protein [Candidatus Eisenbacteria bacterium]|nr:DUF86 domain-containing protein [Candidatus Eisenbacteria bacterium]